MIKEELEHSEWLTDRTIETLAKLYAVNFLNYMNDIETIVSIWYSEEGEELLFSLKIGNSWITNFIYTEVFAVTGIAIENLNNVLKDKIVNRQTNDLRFKEFIALNKLKGDFV